MNGRVRVSLIKGRNRREIVRQSLELISDDVKKGLRSRKPVIKPNLVSPTVQLASSHVDQIRGILDFLTGIYQGRITIAEASCQDTRTAYRNFGYQDLTHEYDVELVELNDGPFEILSIAEEDGRSFSFRTSRLLLDRTNYLISAAKMKTHDTVVVSLSVKNLAMGSMHCDDKKAVHQGIRATNRLIAGIAGRVWPDLAVIDGYEGMEGDGPTGGDAVSLGVAISSTDALAADRIACEVMGAEFHRVGYLHFCAEQGMGEDDLTKIEVIGARVRDCMRPFRLHSSVERQYEWT